MLPKEKKGEINREEINGYYFFSLKTQND